MSVSLPASVSACMYACVFTRMDLCVCLPVCMSLFDEMLNYNGSESFPRFITLDSKIKCFS